MTNQELVLGKTISKVTQMKEKDYDDEGYILMEFTDGTSCIIGGGYDGFTGQSSDEYPTTVYIQSVEKFNLDPTKEVDEFTTTLVPLE